MGFEDFKVIKNKITPLVCKNPKIAGHTYCGPLSSSTKETLEMISEELGELEENLSGLKYVPVFDKHAHKIEEFRGKISKVKEAIDKPFAYAAAYEDAKELLNALRRVRSLDPNEDPETAARAYGAAMTSFGKLIQKLPPPADAVGFIIAEMGKIFHKVVSDIVLQTRESSRNLDKQVLQGGDRSLFEMP